MSSRRLLSTGALAAALALGTACAAGPAGEPFGAPVGAQPGADVGMAAAAGMYADYEALYTGTLESARLAHGRTQNDALRAYSQRVIDDYTTAQGRLAPLMERHRITATPGTTTQALQRGFEQADATLTTYEGAEFDRQWLDRNIAMNRWLLENIDRSYGPGVERHPELRNELNTLRTTIQEHLQEAERIRGTIR